MWHTLDCSPGGRNKRERLKAQLRNNPHRDILFPPNMEESHKRDLHKKLKTASDKCDALQPYYALLSKEGASRCPSHLSVNLTTQTLPIVMKRTHGLAFKHYLFTGNFEISLTATDKSLEFICLEHCVFLHGTGFIDVNAGSVTIINNLFLGYRNLFSGQGLGEYTAFEENRFTGKLDWENISLRGGLCFAGNRLEGGLSFNNCTFQSVDFSNVELDKRLFITNSTFEEFVSFSPIRAIRGEYILEKTLPHCDFTGSVFRQQVVFRGVTFRRQVIFNQCVFEASADFRDTVFLSEELTEPDRGGEALSPSFIGAEFKAVANFKHAFFRSPPHFEGCSGDAFLFDELITEKQEKKIRNHIDAFCPKLKNIQISKGFNNIFSRRPKEGSDKEAYQKAPDLAASAWASLLRIAQHTHNFYYRHRFHELLLEVDHHILTHDAAFKNQRGHRFFYGIYRALGNGRDAVKPLGWLAGSFAIFTALYVLALMLTIPPDQKHTVINMLSKAANMSLAHTIPFFKMKIAAMKDGVPFLIQLILGAQVVGSLALWAALGVSLRNRFRIHG
jgi:uncharacterized protein YjbI with pentapeptide repeats